MSYPWANELVYRLTGSPLPVGRGVPGPSPAAVERAAGPAREPNGDAAGRGARHSGGPAAAHVNVDRLWARAEQQVPTWSVLTLRLANRDAAPAAFTITDGAHWNPFARSTLTLNSEWQPYAAGSRGQKLRGWLRFAHTGELGGVVTQAIAGAGCLGGLFLVYTGVALALRRLSSRIGARSAIRARLGRARTGKDCARQCADDRRDSGCALATLDLFDDTVQERTHTAWGDLADVVEDRSGR